MKQRQRKSKYRRPDKPEPVRFNPNSDLAILRLFAPGEYDYLSAQTIGWLTGRSYQSIKRRLRKLWQNSYLQRWHPPKNYTQPGSHRSVYFLDKQGAAALSQHLGIMVKPKDIQPNHFHPYLKHNWLVNEWRALIHLMAQKAGLQIACEYKDKQFQDYFHAQVSTTTSSGRPVQRNVKHRIMPDWIFTFAPTTDSSGNHIAARTFFCEIERSNQRTKNPQSQRRRYKSLRAKLEAYQFYYLTRPWLSWDEQKRQKYKDIQDLRNLRVLFITEGMGQKEFANLLALARDIDEKGQGLRLFWCVRLEDLNHHNPLENIMQPVFTTPVKDDRLRSLLTP